MYNPQPDIQMPVQQPGKGQNQLHAFGKNIKHTAMRKTAQVDLQIQQLALLLPLPPCSRPQRRAAASEMINMTRVWQMHKTRAGGIMKATFPTHNSFMESDRDSAQAAVSPQSSSTWVNMSLAMSWGLKLLLSRERTEMQAAVSSLAISQVISYHQSASGHVPAAALQWPASLKTFKIATCNKKTAWRGLKYVVAG